jgi:ribosomal protein L12E/L44/L45/RPP1/RPP2
MAGEGGAEQRPEARRLVVGGEVVAVPAEAGDGAAPQQEQEQDQEQKQEQEQEQEQKQEQEQQLEHLGLSP